MSLSIDWIAEQIAADFATHNFQINGAAPTVLYGAEKALHGQPGPRVVVGLNPGFSFGPPSGPNAPGVRVLPGTIPPVGARSVMSRFQAVEIDVKAPPPIGSERDADRSRQAHVACAQLLHETVAALYRVSHGSLAMESSEWIGVGTADMHYPAQCKLRCTVAIPVLDIKWPKVVVAAGPSADPPEPSPVGPSSVYAVDPGDETETLDALTPGT